MPGGSFSRGVQAAGAANVSSVAVSCSILGWEYAFTTPCEWAWRPSQTPVSGLGSVSLRSLPSTITQTFPWPEPPGCGLLCLSGSLGIDKEIDTRHSIYGCRLGSHHAQGFQGQRPFSRPSEGAPCHFSSVCPLFQALTHRNDINPGSLSQTVC